MPGDDDGCPGGETSSSEGPGGEWDTSWCWDGEGNEAADETGAWVCAGCLDDALQPLLDAAGAWVCAPQAGGPLILPPQSNCRDWEGRYTCGICYRLDGSPATLKASGRLVCPHCFMTKGGQVAEAVDPATGEAVCACARDPDSDACRHLFMVGALVAGWLAAASSPVF